MGKYPMHRCVLSCMCLLFDSAVSMSGKRVGGPGPLILICSHHVLALSTHSLASGKTAVFVLSLSAV
jgi:hypothetical protein